MDASLLPYPGGGQEITGFVVNARNITDQRMAEERLNDINIVHEARLKTLEDVNTPEQSAKMSTIKDDPSVGNALQPEVDPQQPGRGI